MIVFLCLFHARQKDIQPVVVGFERLSQHFQPLIHCFDTGLCEPSRPLRAIDAMCYQAGVFEHLEVLGDRRLRKLERLSQFIDSGFASGETRKNRPPRRIGQCGKRSIETSIP